MRSTSTGRIQSRVWLCVLAAAFALLALAGTGTSVAAGPTVIKAPAGAGGSFTITIDPPLSKDVAQANPDSPKTPVDVSIQALDPSGRPLQDAIVDFAMTAPTFTAFSGSDVPRAEGLKLLHLRAATPDGLYRFKYVMPIRGLYHVALSARPVPGRASFAPLSAHPTFVLPERHGELPHLIIFLIGLFLFGLASAIVLTRSQLRVAGRRATSGGSAHPGGGSAARSGRLSAGSLAGGALALLLVGIAAFLVINQIESIQDDNKIGKLEGAGTGISHDAGAGGPVLLRTHLSRSPADRINVRALLEDRGSLVDARTGRPIPGAVFHLSAIDDETHRPAFSATTVSRDGTFAWDQVFWDGVGYKLSVTADPGASGRRFAPLRTGSAIDVEALSPPLLRKVFAQLLLLAAVVAGMLIGVFATRRRARGPSGQTARTGRTPAVASSGPGA